MLKSITFPLPEDVFSNLDTINPEDYIIDTSLIDFGQDDDNIESSIIYIRNLQLHFPLDFSKLSYDLKVKWIFTYLYLGMDKVTIKELDETILTLLARDNIGLTCIFSDKEIKQFQDTYQTELKELLRFLVSLNVISRILIDNKDNKEITYNLDQLYVEEIKDEPKYFKCLTQLIINYPIQIDAIRLFYEEEVKVVLYSYVIQNIMQQPNFYEAFLKLPSISFIGLLHNQE